MHRIYQGRATKLEILEDSNKDATVIQTHSHKDLSRQDNNPLWHHHCFFQDAVNYYLFQLASLAYQALKNKSNNDANALSLAEHLLQKIRDNWSRLSSNKVQSFRDSLKRWLPINDSTTLEEAFDIALEGNDTEPEILLLALQLLLDKCKGDSGIQQGGRAYFPRLTVKSANPTYDYSTETLAATQGKVKLAALLHAESPSLSELESLAQHVELGWTVKLQPNKFLTFEESTAKLAEGIATLQRFLGKPTNNATREFIALYPEWFDRLESLKETLPENIKIPANRKCKTELRDSTLIFKYFPSLFTASLLKLFIAKPRESNDEQDAVDFGKFGDDPIKLARGKRGYIFRSFTALAAWNASEPGEPSWKEFDIAAFKEALKSLNQFNQTNALRLEEKHTIGAEIAYTLGGTTPDKWKPTSNETEDEAPLTTISNTLLETAFALEADLSKQLVDTVYNSEKTQSINFGGVAYDDTPGKWKITKKSLRGLADIASKWEKRLKETTPSVSDLQEIVKDYQRQEKNKKTVGSLPLFLQLCEPKYWALWRNDTTQDSNKTLQHIADLHIKVRDWKKTNEAPNLTPADPRNSRRLYMFSDISGAEKVEFHPDNSFTTTLAYLHSNIVSKQRVKITFSAPRTHRDQLAGDQGSKWLQPMMEALDIAPSERSDSKISFFQSAVSLMPDFDFSGNLRFLLNFAKDLDPTWIIDALNKQSIWKGQFNGSKDKNIFAHWQNAGATTKQYKELPWHNNSTLMENGFDILSIDLGQRTAAAYTIIHITPHKPSQDEKRPWHRIGNDGAKDWYAILARKGTLRLPGEDQKVHRPQLDEHGNPIKGTKTYAAELSGSKGRYTDSKEYQEALDIATSLLSDTNESSANDQSKHWIGEDRKSKSYPEQNDALIALANRRLSRLNTFHRWSCTTTALKDKNKSTAVKLRMIDSILTELQQWSDPEVTTWTNELREHSYLNDIFPKKGNSKLSDDDKIAIFESVFSTEHFEAFAKAAGDRYESYRKELIRPLLSITNRTAPLKKHQWNWQERNDGTPYGELFWAENPDGKQTPRIYGQRGLSMARLESIERLRTLFLRYNRSLDKTPGEPAKVGFGFTHDSGEPAALLLEKMDNLRDQRVNQTAHLILAAALGLRLKAHAPDTKDERVAKDIHGEYEIIPNRTPVDFIVIEDLNRYLTSQGRSPSENSRLMKWSHRAIRDKLKMMSEEVFGIPVLEVSAAYSSRFCSSTSQPGSRCEERPSLDKYLHTRLEKDAQDAKTASKRAASNRLLQQFAKIEEHNSARNGKPPRTLLLPKIGGPLFLPALSGNPFQADINASANIGLRAIASPDALHLIHKIRSERKKDSLLPVISNKREKAIFDKKSTIEVNSPSDALKKAPRPNFFYLSKQATNKYYDLATLTDKHGNTYHLTSSVALHSVTDQLVLDRIVAINDQRLNEWNIQLLDDPNNQTESDDDDHLPGL